MTDPWVDGARSDEARTAPRGRLAILLAIAIALPVLIVVLGSRSGAPTVVEVADAAPTAGVAPSTTEAPTTPPTTAATTTEAEATTTQWSAASTTPTTSWSSSTAAKATTAPSTTAKPSPTTTRAPAKVTPPTTARPVATAPPTTARPPVTAAPANQSAAAFLACVRQRESGGNYAIDTGNGYYGAYQFAQSTWNSSAQAYAGRPDLVGRRPSTVAPSDQDAVALALYLAVGPSPWGGSCH